MDSNVIKGYKWTRPDGMSWYDRNFGPYTEGKTLEVNGAIPGEPCGHGLHFSACIEDAVGYGSFPGALWEVSSPGPILGQDTTKYRVANLTVLRSIEKPTWILSTESSIATIKVCPWFKPTQAPDPKWKHFTTRAAAGDAAWDAAWDAARDAARYAARDAAGDAAWDAARYAAWDAAEDAAEDAAWDAVGDAARYAARYAAGDAAKAATLLTLCSLVADRMDPKHLAYAQKRFAVWQAGYGLLCDIDGVFYTYSKA